MRKKYFTKLEITLWVISTVAAIAAFCLFDRVNYINLAASLIGISALILCAKGNPIGQVLIIIFSALYGIISFYFRYYGELLTYAGMTLPMAVLALISWLRHPYKGNRSQVEVNRLKRWEPALMLALTISVTVIFFFILKTFGTKNLLTSTLSVSTSFAAVYLTFRRSPFFALAYALNDIVLVVLWGLACMEDISYMSTVVCFLAFLANDIYGFISWRAMQNKQTQEQNTVDA